MLYSGFCGLAAFFLLLSTALLFRVQTQVAASRIGYMRQANYGSEPEFDEDLIEEYRRASAETFNAPPSSSLRQPPKQQPFRWPGLDQRRDTIAIDREEMRSVINDEASPDNTTGDINSDTNSGTNSDTAVRNLEDTVFASGAQSKQKWVLDVEGASLFLLPSTDVVVGRKPQSVDGAATMTVSDPGRTLSKSHARLFFKNDSWFVQDLGSTNGTALHFGDSADFREQVLTPGDVFEIAESFRLGTLKVRIRKLIG